MAKANNIVAFERVGPRVRPTTGHEVADLVIRQEVELAMEEMLPLIQERVTQRMLRIMQADVRKLLKGGGKGLKRADGN